MRKFVLPKKAKLPNHVGLICDGNRTWARSRGLPTLVGHKRGFDRVVELVRVARRLGIHTMTIWVFSTENWNRSKEEIKYLMMLYRKAVKVYLKEAHREQVRLVHLGRKDRLPKDLVKLVVNAEKETSGYSKNILNVALDYGGQDEVMRATEKLLAEVRNPKSEIRNDLREEIGRHKKYPIYKFADYLDTAGQQYPYPDLIIRTGGVLRMSGFMIWQAAYAEYYFEPEGLPGFTNEKFKKAIIDFTKRERRFGGDGEQS